MPPLQVGIGICTGRMIGGLIGTANRNNYTVLGDTVNIGNRLCSLASGGQVVIDENTYLKVRGKFEMKEMPQVQLKGIEASIRTYLVNAVKEEKA